MPSAQAGNDSSYDTFLDPHGNEPEYVSPRSTPNIALDQLPIPTGLQAYSTPSPRVTSPTLALLHSLPHMCTSSPRPPFGRVCLPHNWARTIVTYARVSFASF